MQYDVCRNCLKYFSYFILDLNLKGCWTGTAGNNLIVKPEAENNHSREGKQNWEMEEGWDQMSRSAKPEARDLSGFIVYIK